MQFIRDNLAVCGFPGIGTREQFEAYGFTAQLQCAEPFDPWLPECVEVKSLPFDDGAPIPSGIFSEAQDWLAAQWESGSKILISCAGGHSRSVSMAISLLSRESELGFLDAAHEVTASVPEAYPHPHVLVSAASYSGQSLDLDVLRSFYASIRNQPPYPWTDDLLQRALEELHA